MDDVAWCSWGERKFSSRYLRISVLNFTDKILQNATFSARVSWSRQNHWGAFGLCLFQSTWYTWPLTNNCVNMPGFLKDNVIWRSLSHRLNTPLNFSTKWPLYTYSIYLHTSDHAISYIAFTLPGYNLAQKNALTNFGGHVRHSCFYTQRAMLGKKQAKDSLTWTSPETPKHANKEKGYVNFRPANILT